MGEMDEDLFDDFDEAVRLHIWSLNFAESTVEDLLKIKVCCIQKPTLIRIYEFNAFTNLMSLVLNTNKDFNVNPKNSKGLIKDSL
jgi:hypothetical protein